MYIATSMPTLSTNSTDLELLENKGNYLTLVLISEVWYCLKAR